MSANPSFRGAVGLLTVAVVVLAAPAAPGTAAPAPAVAPALGPVHALAVTGVGVGSYPAFDPAIERYAVTTSPSTGGTVTVQATTSDPGGVVRVDGRVAQDSETTLTGLAAGDEVSVVFADAAGVEVHSLVYLPAGFPTLEAVASDPLVMPGQIGLTMF